MEKPVSKSHQGQQSKKALQQSPDVRVQSLPSNRYELRAWHRGRPCTRGEPILTAALVSELLFAATDAAANRSALIERSL